MTVKNPKPIVKYIGEKLTREDRIAIAYIDQILPEQLKNEDCTINTETKTISMGQDKYSYKVYIENQNAYIQIRHVYFINANLYEIEIMKKKINLSHKLKTKKGKTRISLRKLFYLLSMAATVVVSVKGIEQLNINSEPIAIESLSLDEDELAETNPIVISVDETKQLEEKLPEKEIVKETVKTINLVADFEMTDYQGFEKRAETEVLFGDDILKYTNRYGLDPTLAYCHFSFERSNNPNHSLEVRKNIGQLTTAICGEKIVAPVYENGEIVGYDKFFLLPPTSYNSYQKTKALGLELKEKDSSLIIKEWDEIYNQSTNINLSLAYLSYIINSKKEDLVRGVMAYNAGYGSVKDSYSYEDILSGAVKVDDPYYWKHILQYLYPHEYSPGFTIYINGEKYHYKVIQKEKKIEENYEKENGHHL